MKKHLFAKTSVFLLCIVSVLLPVQTVAKQGNQVFFALEIDGKKVGYQKLEWTLRNGAPHFSEVTAIEVMHGKSRESIKYDFSIWQDAESPDLHFMKIIDAGTVQKKSEGLIKNRRILVRNDEGVLVGIPGALPDEIVFPADQLKWYLGKSPEISGPLKFNYFNSQLLASVSVSVSPCDGAPDKSVKTKCWLREFSFSHGANREAWYFDDNGGIDRIETSFSGIPMVKKACAENCMDSVQEPWDFIGRLVVKSPYKIPQKSAAGKINYLLSSKSGKALSFLDSAEQSAEAFGNQSIVSVCANCAIRPLVTVPALEDYSRSNPWVQSDHREIRKLALSAVPKKAPIKTKMLALVKLTQTKMKGTSSYIGYSTALDALRSGSGDCGEFALLLAAFARAQNIPARVVFGMAYSSRFTGKANVFSPHAWVQVWDKDHWVSYDAALGEFDATHIALATSNGNPMEVLEGFNQLSDIRIEKAAFIIPGQ